MCRIVKRKNKNKWAFRHIEKGNVSKQSFERGAKLLARTIYTQNSALVLIGREGKLQFLN